MKPCRFVFEKGVSIQLGEDGYWYLSAVSSSEKPKTINPNKVADIYGVRPILITNKYDTGDTIDFLLPKHIAGKLLDINISEMEQIRPIVATDFYKVFNLVYITT